jgi:hypothetical protein
MTSGFDTEIRMPTSTVESLIQQNKNLTFEISQLAKKLQFAELENDKIRNEIFGIRAVDKEREAEFRATQEKHKELEKQLKATLLERNESEKQFAELYTKSQESEKYWAERVALLKSVMGKLNRFKASYSNRLFPLLKKYKSETALKLRELESKNELIEDFKSQLTEAYHHIQTQSSEHQSTLLQMERDSQAQLDQLENLISRLSNDNSELSSELQLAKKNLDRLQSTSASQENRLVSAERRRDEIEKKYFEVLSQSQEKLLQERSNSMEKDLEISKLKFRVKTLEENKSQLSQELCNSIQVLKEKELAWEASHLPIKNSKEGESSPSAGDSQIQIELLNKISNLESEKDALKAELTKKATEVSIPKEPTLSADALVTTSNPSEKNMANEDLIRESLYRLTEKANKLILY